MTVLAALLAVSANTFVVIKGLGAARCSSAWLGAWRQKRTVAHESNPRNEDPSTRSLSTPGVTWLCNMGTDNGGA